MNPTYNVSTGKRDTSSKTSNSQCATPNMQPAICNTLNATSNLYHTPCATRIGQHMMRSVLRGIRQVVHIIFISEYFLLHIFIILDATRQTRTKLGTASPYLHVFYLHPDNYVIPADLVLPLGKVPKLVGVVPHPLAVLQLLGEELGGQQHA